MRKLATLLGLVVSCLAYASDAEAQYSVTATARVVEMIDASAGAMRLEATPSGMRALSDVEAGESSAILRKAVVERRAIAAPTGRRWQVESGAHPAPVPAAPDAVLRAETRTAVRAETVTVTRYLFANS